MNQLPFMHEYYEKHYFELTAINTFMLLTHTNVQVDGETLQLHIVAQKVVLSVTSHVTIHICTYSSKVHFKGIIILLVGLGLI